MKQSKDTTTVILRRLVQLGAFLILLTPLFWSPFTLMPFVWGKALWLRLVVTLASPLLPLLWARDPESRPRKSLLHLIILAFGVSAVLSTLFGVDAHQSFWGREERLWGVLAIGYLAAGYVIILAAVQTLSRKARVLEAAALISVINALWAALEVIFPDFWREFRGGDRAIGTIGNPIFLGSYLLLSTFLALAAARAARTSGARILFCGIALLDVGAMFLTGSRGPALGLIVGVAVTVLVFIARAGVRKLFRTHGRSLGIFLGAAALVVTVLFITGAPRQVRRVFDIPRGDATVTQRLLLWKTAITGWRDRPLLGWGPENFDYLFDRHFDPQFLRFSIRETWADRAHNIFFELLTTQGLVGVLIGGFLLAAVARRALRREPLEAAIVMGMLGAYLGQGMAAFNTLPTMIPLLVAAAYLEAPDMKHETRSSEQKPADRMQAPWPLAVPVAVLVALGSIILFVVAGIRPALASNALLHAMQARDLKTRSAESERALVISEPYRDDLRLRFANMVFLQGGDGDTGKLGQELLLRAIREMRASVTAHPADYAYRFTLANLTLSFAIDYDPAAYGEAERLLLEAAPLSPRRQATWMQLGNQKLIEKDAAAAIGYFQKARDLDLSVGEPHWGLGRAYADAGAADEAHAAFDESRRLGYISNLPGELNVALAVYESMKDYRGMLELFMRLFNERTPDGAAYGGLAEVLARMGENDCARRAVAKAVERDPSAAGEAEVFLARLAADAYRENVAASAHPLVSCDRLMSF